MVGLGVPAGIVVVALLGLGWRYRAWLEEPVAQRGTLDSGALEAIRTWQSRDRRGPPGLVLFGNSLTNCKEDTSIGQALARDLTTENMPHTVVTVWSGAFSPLHYYELLDDVIAGAPAAVVMQIDVPLLASVDVSPGLRHLALSRKLTFARALQVRDALTADGITLFDPPLYRLESRLGILYVVPGLQDRWRTALDDVGDRLSQLLGLRRVQNNPRNLRLMRGDATRARSTFLRDLTQRPLTGVLRTLRRELRRAGTAVLFYVSPINVGAIKGFSSSDARLLEERIAGLERAVGATPEEWVDLHAAVPPADFRDWVGHMFPAGCERVGTALSEALRERLPRASPRTTDQRRNPAAAG